MAKELSVPVGHHGFGDAVESNNLFEVEIGNLSGIMSCMAWHKVSYLRESIHDHHDSILMPLSPRQPRDKVKRNILLRGIRHGQRI